MGPTFVRFQKYGQQVPGGAWWLVMAPGLMLIAMGVAILVWPELLAYMVAFVILSLGITVTGWGWRLRQVEGRRSSQVNQASGQPANIVSPMHDEERASDTVIYYER